MNPKCDLGEDKRNLGKAEAVVLVDVLGRDGRISLDHTRQFFVQETFPPEWQKHPSFGVLYLLRRRKELEALIQKEAKKLPPAGGPATTQ